MPNVNAGDFFSCVNGCYFVGEAPGAQLAINDYWVQVQSLVGGPFTYQDLANALANYFSPNYAPLISGSSSFVGSAVRYFQYGNPAIQDKTGTITAQEGTALIIFSGDPPATAIGELITITQASIPVYNGQWRIRQVTPTGLVIGSTKFAGQPPATGFTYRVDNARPAPTYSTTAPVVGTGGATPCPLQTCGLLSLTNGLTGRQGLNRWYIPFPGVLSCSTTGPTDAYVSAITAPLGASLLGIQPVPVGANAINVIFGYAPIRQSQIYVPMPGYQTARGIKRWATQRRRGQFGRVNNNPWGNL